jgi:hypothetical protein
VPHTKEVFGIEIGVLLIRVHYYGQRKKNMKTIIVLATILTAFQVATSQTSKQPGSAADLTKHRIDSLDRVFRIKMNAILSQTIPEENGDRVFQPKMIDSTTMEVTPVGPSIRYHLFDPNDIFHIGGGEVGDFVPVTRRDEAIEKMYREASGE